MHVAVSDISYIYIYSGKHCILGEGKQLGGENMASSIRFGYCAIIMAKYALSQLIVRGVCHVASCQYCLLWGLTRHRPAPSKHLWCQVMEGQLH